MTSAKPVIIVTPGEPAGIGPEIVLRAAAREFGAALVAIADMELMRDRARALGLDIEIVHWRGQAHSAGTLCLMHEPLEQAATPGELNPANARYVLNTLSRAVTGCLEKKFSALVTGPVHKAVINQAGIPFSGHTELLAELTGNVTPVMMLASPRLRVALVTTHLALHDVPRHITRERIQTVVEIAGRDLRDKLGIEHPVLSVCGLNPHAGEGGYLGREEIEIIVPAIEALRARGWRIGGPYPADTVFAQSDVLRSDVVFAMYHDQGLPVIKYDGFGETVNITLGLPIIRTSVDHGAALDIAVSGHADARSLVAAINTAIDQAQRQMG